MNAIPGLAVGRWPAAPRPTRLIGGPGVLLDSPPDLQSHRLRWGPVPRLDLDGLIAATCDVVGAGGAQFPTPRKLRGTVAPSTATAGRSAIPVALSIAVATFGQPADARLVGHPANIARDRHDEQRQLAQRRMVEPVVRLRQRRGLGDVVQLSCERQRST